jgi:hypothetical protein
MILPLLLVTTVLGLAACGSSDPNAGGSTSAQNDPARAGQALAFAKCMRSHGVSNFPDPTNGELRLQVQKTPNSTSVNGVEVNGPVFQSAMQACRSHLPNGGHPSAAQTAKAKAQALAMSRCMRSHGVPNFPDPEFGTGPGGGFGIRIGGPGSRINPSSPAFQAAQKVCGKIFGGALKTQKVAG